MALNPYESPQCYGLAEQCSAARTVNLAGAVAAVVVVGSILTAAIGALNLLVICLVCGR